MRQVTSRKELSLEQMILRVVMITSALVLSVATFIFVMFVISEMRQSEKRRLVTLSKFLALNLSSPLAFNDAKETLKLIDSLSKQKLVKGIAVFDANSNVIVSQGEMPSLGLEELEAQGLPEAGDLIVMPVFSDKDKVGTLVIQQDFTALRSMYYSFSGVVIFVLLLSFGLAYFLSSIYLKSISRYFLQFINLVKSVSRGDYKARVDLQKVKLNILEFSVLSIEFNHMIELIESRDRQINEANSLLEIKVQERTAELEREKAKQVDTAKMAILGEMAGSVAHEINTPLSTVVLASQSAQKRLKKGEVDIDFLTSRFAVIEKTANRIGKIILSLRKFSRDATQDPFLSASVEVIIRDTLELCGERVRNNGILIEFENSEPQLMIECREVQISQVVLNLISNAVDVVAALEEKWIKINVSSKNKMVEIRVADSGKGVPQDIQEKIFNPFFTTKDIGKGTGIGLSISKGIVDDHAGKLSLDIKASNTTFVITLPIRQSLAKSA